MGSLTGGAEGVVQEMAKEIDKEFLGGFTPDSGHNVDQIPQQEIEEAEDLGEGEVDENVEEEAAAEEESAGRGSDPVNLYLQELRSFPLLTREQEVEAGKQIADGETQVIETVLSTPLVLRHVLEWADRVGKEKSIPLKALASEESAGEEGDFQARLLKERTRLRRLARNLIGPSPSSVSEPFPGGRGLPWKKSYPDRKERSSWRSRS